MYLIVLPTVNFSFIAFAMVRNYMEIKPFTAQNQHTKKQERLLDAGVMGLHKTLASNSKEN